EYVGGVFYDPKGSMPKNCDKNNENELWLVNDLPYQTHSRTNSSIAVF
ncbi:hypothetical protein VSAK1_11248, partial [Vibrio mediterranei AK1]